jgi:hypothetical protein
MNLFKKYGVLFAVVFVVLVLVILRTTNTNHFRGDSRALAQPSLSHSNMITKDKITTLTGKSLILNLDKEVNQDALNCEVMNIDAESVLKKDFVKSIRNREGAVIITSSDEGVSARVWMLLSQLGCNKLYILDKSTDNEVLKYKFRPDTLNN